MFKPKIRSELQFGNKTQQGAGGTRVLEDEALGSDNSGHFNIRIQLNPRFCELRCSIIKAPRMMFQALGGCW